MNAQSKKYHLPEADDGLPDETDQGQNQGTKNGLDVEGTSVTDNVGEISVEINVEDLISELEGDLGIDPSCKVSPSRKRLDEVLEERKIARELEEMDDF